MKIEKLVVETHAFYPSEPRWICHVCGENEDKHNFKEAVVDKINELIEILNGLKGGE